MFNIALVIFVSFELCYYLLIAQTGIVEIFHSNLMIIGYLPAGGIIGSFLSSHINIQTKYKVYGLLCLQLAMTFFYPELNSIELFLLGIAVGGMAPLIIHELKKANSIDLVLALCISYTAGTLLFNTDPSQRMGLAVLLTVIAFCGYMFLNTTTKQNPIQLNAQYPLWMMVLWVFLDSALFETLSRDIAIPIWRGGYTFEIVLFHIVGVIAAIYFKIEKTEKPIFILVLFSLSYMFYFLREPLLLSVVYPFVISYYNVVILQSLTQQKSLKNLGISMVFIGWIASGMGLMIALEEIIIFLPILFVILFLLMVNQEIFISKKEASHG